MSSLKVFSVHDAKAGAYLPPMFFVSKGVAIRAFSAAIADPQHEFSRYAEDFTLFELGEFDQLSGSFALHKSPIPVGKAVEFKVAA